MKKLTATIFFLVALALTSIAEEPKGSNQDFVSAFGLDLTKTYTATDLNDLFKIVFEEADASIGTAFSEGYKAGLLDCEPKNVELENQNKALNAELQAMKKKMTVPWWTIPGAIAVGFATGEIFEALR